MPGYFDRREIQTPKSRDAALFRDLKAILSFAKIRAPSLREQLRSVDLNKLKTRADLACIPVIRRSDLLRLQDERPPLGGFAARSPGALKNILVGAGPMFLPEGASKDWWRAARPMNAAGFKRGSIIINGFDEGSAAASARMVESGAAALGCAVAPICGNADLDWRIEMAQRLGASAYCGPAERLKRMLAGAEARRLKGFPIKSALIFEAEAQSATDEFVRARQIDLVPCYVKDELGVIAYGSSSGGELVVNEGFIVEIVRPMTGQPLPFGSVGEIVVTRLSSEFPLLRFATGDLSVLLPGPSPCGRTNLRLHKIMGRVEECAEAQRPEPSAPSLRRGDRGERADQVSASP